MKFSKTVLEGITYHLPDEIWTSQKIEKDLEPLYQRLNLNEGRLEFMTGIKERRLWPLETLPSKVASAAAEKLLNQTKVKRDAIDTVIYCGVCRDRIEPATAAYVHQQLGLSNKVQIFDLSNACLGFLNGILMGASLIESRQAQNVLLVAGENGRSLVENTLIRLNKGDLDREGIKPYFANLTIGAGAVAGLLCAKVAHNVHKPKIVGSSYLTDTAANQLCEGGVGENTFLEMQTEAEALLEAGIALAKKNWIQFLDTLHWREDTIDRIVCHQVGLRHQLALLEALGIDASKDFSTFSYLGNTGSAGLPIALAKAMEENFIEPGDCVALLGIGSGLSSIMLGMEF